MSDTATSTDGMAAYGDRLAAAIAARGRLCVGIDPHPQLLTAWGLPVSASGLERCALGMVEALGETVAVFKPQSALFEVFGSAGIAVLERVLAESREAGALTVLDAKRGDIGSTMAAYARAYLDDSSPLAADALTVNPFLGFGSLGPAVELAEQFGKGLYVLCRTSNPESGQIQQALAGERTVAQLLVDEVNAANADRDPGAFGLVIGGTLSELDVDLSGFTGSILVPGIGAQGGTIDSLGRLFGDAADRVLPTSSREIMGAGPRPEELRRAVAANLGHGGPNTPSV